MSDLALRARWEALRTRHRVALIPYLTAGYPSRDATLEALSMAAESGADFIELGVPFSDPVADGPVIQRSSQTALTNGMNVQGVLQLVGDARLPVPVVIFGYLNPILAYGIERFVRDAEQAGVAGLLVTDLPPGEDPALEGRVRASALALIPLVAPTTEGERLQRVVDGAEGFVYLIARMGVTGAQTDRLDLVAQQVSRIRSVTTLPVAVGFGIRTGAQAATVAAVADGVVVGTALVEQLGLGMEGARTLLVELRRALDEPRPPG